MFKKILAGMLAAALCAAPALAEVYSGVTSAYSTLAITADAGGLVRSLNVEAGSAVNQGDSIAQIEAAKVFARQDGTIARIHASEGSRTEGAVLELAPVSRYTVHCTTDGGYDSIANNRIHCGETLYMMCSSNGTHQGSGTVYSIDGETFMLQADGGEFYVGEAVYLYRDAQHSYKQLVGMGTVVTSAAESYESTGMIAKIHVSEGEYVQRGELLYEVIEGESAAITAPAGGIITSCEIDAGANVAQGETIATMVSGQEIYVSFEADEAQAAQLCAGSQLMLNYACEPEDSFSYGQIVDISNLSEDGFCTVWVKPEVQPAYLGMSVLVQTLD